MDLAVMVPAPVGPVLEPVESVLVPARDLNQLLAPVHLVNRSPILREEYSALFCQSLLVPFPSLMASLPARKLFHGVLAQGDSSIAVSVAASVAASVVA
ncbi:hypothetical protein CYMTET_18366 [Cymbomonas tetramitiformis]|uniref:Uncharacterized protein n=1 Tax=Cymbomonas tetramitiformis TaxID=36881 RepID=A0AAE0G8K1_9CHLO|nr:hypothetical protein CYMTET_18366 [Cymbomonas tetramitiformis]